MTEHKVEFKVTQSRNYNHIYVVTMYLNDKPHFSDSVSSVPNFMFNWRVKNLKRRFWKALNACEKFTIVPEEENTDEVVQEAVSR